MDPLSTCCLGEGLRSQTRAPLPFLSPLHLRAKGTWALSQRCSTHKHSIYIYIQQQQRQGGHPFRDDSPERKSIQYIQVRGAFKVKKGNVEVGSQGMNPMRSNTPPQPSCSPRRAEEETSHSASKGTKGQVERRPKKRSSDFSQTWPRRRSSRVIQDQVK